MYPFLVCLQVREVQLPHQEVGELLCFLVSCFSCSSRTGQIKLKNIQLLTQRCWSSPQVCFYILLFMQNISGLEIGTVAQSPYFVMNRGMIFHGSTAVV